MGLFKDFFAKKPSYAKFDINRMFFLSVEAIKKFSCAHTDEVFYAFSIDSSFLCLNSIEKFDETLKNYQRQDSSYYSHEEINELKYNTGDWAYKDFYTLEEGFDEEFYSEHYHIPFDNPNLTQAQLEAMQEQTPYHKAMEELLHKISTSGILNSLNQTKDFKVFLSEHNY